MKYRPLGAGLDYTVGIPFLSNSPVCVAQAVLTRLKLWQGEWFIDTSDGTPWLQSILGKQNGQSPDVYIKQRILATPNVTAITAYSGTYDGPSRAYTVNVTITTAFGTTSLSVVL